MSRSKKDGRKGGGHKDTEGLEVWSRRPTRYRMCEPNRVVKTNTHRCERRESKKMIRQEREEL